MLALSAHPGESTRPISKSKGSGIISIAQSISRARQSISCSGKHRDKAAAIRFFEKAITNNKVPEKITLDGYEATHRAVAELKSEGVLPAQIEVRTNKYLNNLIEQDHRRIKQRYYPMLGFKKFRNATVTLGGIELAAKIKKEQYDTSAVIQVRNRDSTGMGSGACRMSREK